MCGLRDGDDCNLVHDQSVSSSSCPDCYVYLWLYDYCGLKKGREREGERETMCLISLCSKTRGDSIRLAPEDISPQLLVGMLTGIKNVCLPLLS